MTDDWRISDAKAIDTKVIRIGDCLRELEDVHAICEADKLPNAVTEIRATLALLRSLAGTYIDEARELRAAARDTPRPEAHRAHTIRRVQ
jgi:hypothetical protein